MARKRRPVPPRIFDEIAALRTEAVNPRTTRIDKASTLGILKAINREDRLVAPAVARAIPQIAAAVETVVSVIKHGGRVFYVGAGTSGRLGVLDAAECPPTFGTRPELFQAIMAGGRGAVFRAREGAEDRTAEARRMLALRRVSSRDVVVGLAACRRTPFVVAALEEARRIGARTIYITCNPSRVHGVSPDVVIAVNVGPEVIMGSTRMKAGTAEKLVLNMISTAAMIKLGKVYQNLMVDLWATSEKLRQRSVRIMMLATGCDYADAVEALRASRGSVKAAVLASLSRPQSQEARSEYGRRKRTVAAPAPESERRAPATRPSAEDLSERRAHTTRPHAVALVHHLRGRTSKRRRNSRRQRS